MELNNHKAGVLVVDDECGVVAMLQRALESHGFDVRVACNGHEAIRLYRAHRDRIAMVLLEVRMPGLDGPHTLDALRELNPGLLACFMTAGDTGEYRLDDLIRRGAATVFTKPFHLNELLSRIRLLTQGASALESWQSRRALSLPRLRC